MLLAIVDLGYQSCWYEGHITDTDRICDKIAESEPSMPRKKAFEERAWFNGFGAKG
jgi:hypothetical protein